MVDLPSVPNRLVLTETPRSRVSATDVTAGGRALAGALDQTGSAVLEVERAVRQRQLADIGLSIDHEINQAALDHAGDPEGFKAWAQGYQRQLLREHRSPFLRNAVDTMAKSAAAQKYDALTTQLHNATFANAKTAMVARLDQIDEQMAALAHDGLTKTEEYTNLATETERIYGELSRQPLYGVPKESIDALRARSQGRHIAEAIVGGLTKSGADLQAPDGSVVDKIINAESGGNTNAQATGSSAAGAGQFTDSTWLDVVHRYRPDLENGRSREELLALRNDPVISREMVGDYAASNANALATAGHPPTARNLYLAHFLGPGGAVAVLNAAPSTPIKDALTAGGVSASQADAMISANASILDGKTVGDVATWAAGKVGDSNDPASILESALWDPSLNLSPSDRRQFISYGLSEISRSDAEKKRVSGKSADGWERAILDGAASIKPLPSRNDIENDPNLTEGDRNTLLRQYDAAAKDVNDANAAYARFLRPDGGGFTAYEPDDLKALDAIYKKLGGDGVALKTVVDQTGIVPPSVTKVIRGDLAATDPQRMAGGLQLADNMLAANPNAFSGQGGAPDIEKQAFTYRHYIDDLGYTADQAATRIAQMNDPAYASAVKAKVKDEDIAKLTRDNLSVGDLRSAFDSPGLRGWLPGRPTIGMSAEARQGMFTDYAELFRDRYLENGDVGLSKKLAIEQLKRVWGTSTVNGSDTVMRYPPERAPGMEKIANPSELIAADAVDSIAGETGTTVGRDKIRIFPIAGATAAAFKSGQPVPYQLFWENADGILQGLNPGRAFIVDPTSLADRQSTLREKAFREGTVTGGFRGAARRGGMPEPVPQPRPPSRGPRNQGPKPQSRGPDTTPNQTAYLWKGRRRSVNVETRQPWNNPSFFLNNDSASQLEWNNKIQQILDKAKKENKDQNWIMKQIEEAKKAIG